MQPKTLAFTTDGHRVYRSRELEALMKSRDELTEARPATTGNFVLNHDTLIAKFARGSRTSEAQATIIFHSAKHFNPLTQSYYWECPITYLIDGASIPRALWSLVGGPYSGKYRLSSAVHDVHCPSSWYQDTIELAEARKAIPFKTVHAVFGEMIAVEGVKGWRLGAMKRGVQWGGPRW